MKKFQSFDQADNFVKGLNIPEEEIQKDLCCWTVPGLWFEYRFKNANCDGIKIVKQFEENTYKPYWEVKKFWYSGPLSLSETLGMSPKRFKIPNF